MRARTSAGDVSVVRDNRRRLFCEISPLTYRISELKERGRRYLVWGLHPRSYARERSTASLPVLVYGHNSLIRRQLGEVDPALQENKATNLGLAAPQIDGVLVPPGRTFSFWRLVGEAAQSKGYCVGLVIRNGSPSHGVGGGLCQLSNLLHWMVLHSSLTIVEHHHHNELDLFPDFDRVLPFGTGTSVAYNNVDYQFRNDTPRTYQVRVAVTATHLRGELRACTPEPRSYHIVERDPHFSREPDGLFRNNAVHRRVVDKRTGRTVSDELLLRNRARVMYDEAHIDPGSIRVLSTPDADDQNRGRRYAR